MIGQSQMNTYQRGESLENSAYFNLCFDWLYFTQSLSSFSSVDHLFRLYAQFFILFHLT